VVLINLLPLKVRKTKVALRLYTYIIIAGSMVAIVLVFILLNILAQTKRIDVKVDKLKIAETSLADKTGPLLGLVEQEKKITAIQAMVKDLTKEQPIWINILNELADQIQGDMWLTKVLSKRQEKERVLVLTLEGEAYHKISVADFLTMLENSQLFTNVSLEALTETKVKQVQHVQFKLKMEYAQKLAAPIEEKKSE
jgi:Tfp pilus assembly protein PilN